MVLDLTLTGFGVDLHHRYKVYIVFSFKNATVYEN